MSKEITNLIPAGMAADYKKSAENVLGSLEGRPPYSGSAICMATANVFGDMAVDRLARNTRELEHALTEMSKITAQDEEIDLVRRLTGDKNPERLRNDSHNKENLQAERGKAMLAVQQKVAGVDYTISICANMLQQRYGLDLSDPTLVEQLERNARKTDFARDEVDNRPDYQKLTGQRDTYRNLAHAVTVVNRVRTALDETHAFVEKNRIEEKTAAIQEIADIRGARWAWTTGAGLAGALPIAGTVLTVTDGDKDPLHMMARYTASVAVPVALAYAQRTHSLNKHRDEASKKFDADSDLPAPPKTPQVSQGPAGGLKKLSPREV